MASRATQPFQKVLKIKEVAGSYYKVLEHFPGDLRETKLYKRLPTHAPGICCTFCLCPRCKAFLFGAVVQF